ncbi:hypothetical protein ABENE_13260 [Asticcacaulis benevestitus DSM 16100 = ATCC BAA-896]|uniref:Uncharacterized protein n=1 Tax=Asticcacaulis benevestitus DSM 16100 = ATCC BAA-896 TaxID=1121022 RepID=V4RF06_9CAUL|nr:hypothetical protein ABENE_13260 [Asticcacaulis benevestitus DSM 16100 = ATCC BAA-896]
MKNQKMPLIYKDSQISIDRIARTVRFINNLCRIIIVICIIYVFASWNLNLEGHSSSGKFDHLTTVLLNCLLLFLPTISGQFLIFILYLLFIPILLITKKKNLIIVIREFVVLCIFFVFCYLQLFNPQAFFQNDLTL